MIYLEGASLRITTATEIAELGCQSRASKPVERMFVGVEPTVSRE